MRTRFNAFLIFTILLFILSGCSIGGKYYIRNFSSQAARVILTYTEPAINIYKEPTYRYSTEIRKIKRNLYKKLNNSITGKVLDANSVEFTMPPKSTVFFAIGTNMRLSDIESIKVESKNGDETIESTDYKRLNIQVRGIGQYTGHFDIRE